MPFGTSGSDGKRIVAGFAFLVFGLLLVLWAWGSFVIRATSSEIVGAQASSEVTGFTPEQAAAVNAVPWFLMVAFVLILTFITASVVLVRAARRHRAAADDGHRTPTRSQDVWAMHRLPEDDLNARQNSR